MLKMIKTETLNECFMNWVVSFLPEKVRDLTISLDGKTICSTNRISKMDSPLHIISAQISELGLTLAQRSTDEKSNEIPAVQELLKALHIEADDHSRCDELSEGNSQDHRRTESRLSVMRKR